MGKQRINNRRYSRNESDIEKAKEIQSTRGDDIKGLPVDKRYKVDPEYSRDPTAICQLKKMFDIPEVCDKECNGYCYWRKVCSSQLDINGDGTTILTKEAQALLDEEYRKAIEHSKDLWSKHRVPETTDLNIDEMVKAILRNS